MENLTSDNEQCRGSGARRQQCGAMPTNMGRGALLSGGAARARRAARAPPRQRRVEAVSPVTTWWIVACGRGTPRLESECSGVGLRAPRTTRTGTGLLRRDLLRRHGHDGTNIGGRVRTRSGLPTSSTGLCLVRRRDPTRVSGTCVRVLRSRNRVEPSSRLR